MSQKSIKSKKSSKKVKSIKKELKLLESRLNQSEKKKTLLKEENQSMVRLHRDMVELERLKRENAEKELMLVESELKSINQKRYLKEFQPEVNCRNAQLEIEAIEMANSRWGGLYTLLDKAESMKKRLLLLDLENERLMDKTHTRTCVHKCHIEAEEALQIKRERLILLAESEKQARLKTSQLELTVKEMQSLIYDLKQRLEGKVFVEGLTV